MGILVSRFVMPMSDLGRDPRSITVDHSLNPGMCRSAMTTSDLGGDLSNGLSIDLPATALI